MPDWDMIIREHKAAVWRTAYRLVGNPSDADECMQEAFVAAVALARRSQVRNWPAILRRLAMARGIDCLRRRVSNRASIQDESTLASAMDREAFPDAIAQKRELVERLRLALAQLPPLQAQAACLRYLDEMEYEEISHELQISVRHVGVVLSRAREKLRKLLKERGADHG